MLASLLVGLWSLLAFRPRVFTDAPRDVLVCAPHSDDCVILGAEYAYDALAAGRSVHIVYATCSSNEPGDELSLKRQNEALGAWGSVDVPACNLTFLDLPQASAGVPSEEYDRLLLGAQDRLGNVVRALPEESAIILPAHGESHPDHVMTRRLVVDVLAQTTRPGLIAYEVPEYNQYVCLLRSPSRARGFALGSLPLANRFIPLPGGADQCGFVCGGAGFLFPDEPSRREMKLGLLRQFHSQDGELLCRLFGHSVLYRRVQIKPGGGEPCRRVGLSISGRCLSPSALLLWAAILACAAAVSHFAVEVFRELVPASWGNGGLLLIGAGCASVCVLAAVRMLRRKSSVRAAVALWAMAGGALTGLL